MTTALLAVLDVALDTLRVSALIVDVDERGGVVCSNAAARGLMGGGTGQVSVANVTGRSEGTWEVPPPRGIGVAQVVFVIWRAPDVPSRRRWNLTVRQAEVMHLIARGLTNASIAEMLGIRPGTVEFRISAIRQGRREQPGGPDRRDDGRVGFRRPNRQSRPMTRLDFMPCTPCTL